MVVGLKTFDRLQGRKAGIINRLRGGGLSLDGEKKLLARLRNLQKLSTMNRMARPALRESAAEIRKVAKRLAPKEGGFLRKSIKSVVRTGKNGVYAVIGPAYGSQGEYNGKYRDPAKYAHLVEFGTKPHLISPSGDSGAVGTLRIGQTFVAGAIQHPGAAPKPFLRPAYDSVNSKAIIAKRLGKELDKEAAKRR